MNGALDKRGRPMVAAAQIGGSRREPSDWTAQQLIAAGKSYSEVECLWCDGRVSGREMLRYVRAWSWSAARFSGAIGEAHERWYQRFGEASYYRRINRMRRALGLEVRS
jgi:hypothetical protein